MLNIPIRFTYRRRLLDKYLQSASALMTGAVAEIGGTEARHGQFKPPLEKCDEWVTVDIDPDKNPDVVADAHELPFEDHRFDTIVSIELLEHVKDPDRVLKQFARVLLPGGRLIMSMPFLQPVHASPSDYQRFTDVQLRHTLENAGFVVDNVEPMGGFYRFGQHAPNFVISRSSARGCEASEYPGMDSSGLLDETGQLLGNIVTPQLHFWILCECSQTDATDEWQGYLGGHVIIRRESGHLATPVSCP